MAGEDGNSGGGNKSSVIIAAIGAVSAITVGMLQTKVWPFNAADKDEVVAAEGEAAAAEAVGEQPSATLLEAEAAPSGGLPESTVEFDDAFAVKGGLLASKAQDEERQLVVANQCAVSITVDVAVWESDAAVGGDIRTWTLAPQASGRLTVDGYPLVVADGALRYAAMAPADTKYVWAGDDSVTYGETEYNLLRQRLTEDGSGHKQLTLTCE